MVTSRVLAGTISKTGDDEKDLALAASLARSSKDLEEHEYAVRSVADALEPFCTSTNVPESPFVLHLANVMHLATDVTGALIESKIDVDATDIFSAASCTTNCIAPILHIVENKYNVVKGHLETVHSYTNDQNLLDNMHKKPRRGRSAAINMVITSTGAGKAVTKVIPSLEGKLSANAVRVPTPNVSLAILKLTLDKETSVADMNATMRDAALKGNLVNQINYQVEPDLVSTDIIGNTCCSIYDSNATICTEEGKDVVLYIWYDNEFGYTKQVIRLAKLIAKVRRLTYY